MSLKQNENREKLLLSFDQLAEPGAFHQGSWSKTTAALRSIERLLSYISLGSAPETIKFADISFPDIEDPLFSWFLDFQDTFEGNISSHLLHFLSRLSDRWDTDRSQSSSGLAARQLKKWTTRALSLLQGCLLLHEPSRSLITRRPNMKLLISYIDIMYGKEVCTDAIQTLVSALVDRPGNLRVFEDVDGIAAISRLFKAPGTPHEVKVKILEFLYFYLIPESISPVASPTDEDASGSGTQASQQTTLFHGPQGSVVDRNATIKPTQDTVQARRHAREPATHGEHDSSDEARPLWRTTAEKQEMLGEYFSNIDALVKDLNDFKPFGEF